MNPVVIAAGVYISAKIINFIAGEISEEEKEKRIRIEKQIDEIKNKYQFIATDDSVEILNNCDEIIKKIIQMLTEAAQNQLYEHSELNKEIYDSITKVTDTIHGQKSITTPLRRSSLERLLRQLHEARQKSTAYKQYLESYIRIIQNIRIDEEIPLFEFRLPKDFPYIGKIIWIHADQITDNNKITYKLISPLNSIEIVIKDIDLLTSPTFPIMITSLGSSKCFASIEKGEFKAYELINTHAGFSATVTKIRKKSLILTYKKNLSLFLPEENLLKTSHYPPIRSTVTVYPKWWEYDLNSKESYKCPVKVSEKRENATFSYGFTCFPLCFSKEALTTFLESYDDIIANYSEEEFLLGSLKTDDVQLKKGTLLKLQLGDIPLIIIEIDEHIDQNNNTHYFFRFNRFCSPNEPKFTSDDIFVPFDVSLAPYLENTPIDKIIKVTKIKNYDDISSLIWELIEELHTQYEIRKNREGLGYFLKWENITCELISQLEQGDSYSVKLRWQENDRRNSIFAEILDVKGIQKFITKLIKKMDAKLMHEWKPHFFVKDENGNRYSTSILDSGHLLRIDGFNIKSFFFEKVDELELFAAMKPYAEYQQKEALRKFRIGQVVNPTIQSACLNSSTIISKQQEDSKLSSFFNTKLLENESQRKAVEMSYREKNIFFIQGPPGTGKTTVIREVVEQLFNADSKARVLIVSQANVAVDNALTGLIDKYGSQVVRCGNGSKISSSLQNLRLQNRCQEYLDSLEKRKDRFDDDFFCNWRDTITSSETTGISPVLCELIIRNYRLIGATCVGLAKRNIGLERIEFDLVIIDEAGKALPAEMLIPLLRAKKAIIIGDQNQLPPVINPLLFNKDKFELEERSISENELFYHSFFERLYNNAPETNKIMLNTQYRMPPIIGNAISTLFYNRELINGSGTEKKRPILFSSYLTFLNYDHNSDYHECVENKRVTNHKEALDVVALVLNIRKKDTSCSIAIITPYKGQKRLIDDTLINYHPDFKTDSISVDTVDAFQGSEADVVIFCNTRSEKPTPFFKDSRRINVALSRAKRELIILGKLQYYYKFKFDSCLPKLADYIKKNKRTENANNCSKLRISHKKIPSKRKIIPIEEIALSQTYYCTEKKHEIIKQKINEFYSTGTFSSPIEVKYMANKYFLQISSFEQYIATQELHLTECICLIID